MRNAERGSLRNEGVCGGCRACVLCRRAVVGGARVVAASARDRLWKSRKIVDFLCGQGIS